MQLQTEMHKTTTEMRTPPFSQVLYYNIMIHDIVHGPSYIHVDFREMY